MYSIPKKGFKKKKLSSSGPISSNDLCKFIVLTIDNENMKNKIIPIGGPGPARNSKEFGELIFQISGRSPKFFYFPSIIFKILIYMLKPFSFGSRKIADKIEFLKIAHYYATESMLYWDEKSKMYLDHKTKEFGDEKIDSHYELILSGRLKLSSDYNQKLF